MNLEAIDETATLTATIQATDALSILAWVQSKCIELKYSGWRLAGVFVPKEGFEALLAWGHPWRHRYAPPGMGFQPDRIRVAGVVVKPVEAAA